MIFFSWKKEDDTWAEVDSAPSAQEAIDLAYENRGRRRGGWITGDDESRVQEFVKSENERIRRR